MGFFLPIWHFSPHIDPRLPHYCPVNIILFAIMIFGCSNLPRIQPRLAGQMLLQEGADVFPLSGTPKETANVHK
jgi:hypothetical protein